MTTPNGNILFNSSTGSDSLASGIGPSTALNGSTGSCTSGSAVVTGITTTGVSAGDLFWGSTSAGRQFSIIASVDSSSQVTLDDTLGATHSGNLTWAIGGKRATLDDTSSRLIITTDGKAGWVLETETDQTISSVILWSIASIMLEGTAGAKRVITQSANAAHFDSRAAGQKLKNLKFQNSNGTKTSADALTTGSGGAPFNCRDCVFGDATNTLRSAYKTGSSGNRGVTMVECEITACTFAGIDNGTNIPGIYIFLGCHVHDNSGPGLSYVAGTTAITIISLFSVFAHNSGDGITGRRLGSSSTLLGNVFHENTGDGISSDSGAIAGQIMNNIFDRNGAYGVSVASEDAGLIFDYNAFYSNTSGELQNITHGDNDVTLTADPYTDHTTNDFSLNSTAGGGAACADAGFPQTLPGA